MDHRWILSPPEYYSRLNYYLKIFTRNRQEEIQDLKFWSALLDEVLGEPSGNSVLDCSCGWGRQAIPLAKLGWQVTACDISESSIEVARKCADKEGVLVDFQICNMCDLARVFSQRFDWVVSCYALYEIPTDDGLRQAVKGIFSSLKPGGKCYLRFRDMDFLMEEQPRHVFCREKRISNGRIIWIEDWEYESEATVIALDAFLRENESIAPTDHFRWVTETIGVRKKVLRKADLQDILIDEGFFPVTFLPQAEPWMEVQIVASRPR